jgi:hypothetical protein
VLFIGQRSGEQLLHISQNIEDKIHCTVSKLDETFEIFFSHVKVQQLDDICQIRR